MNLDRKKQLLDAQISAAKGGNPNDLRAWKDRTLVVLRSVMGEDAPAVTKFSKVSYSPSMYTSSTDFRPYRVGGVQSGISILEAAKLELDLQAELAEEMKPATGTAAVEGGRSVFIVHGHDGEKKHELARVLEALTGDTPIILHEQPNMGQVLIEKFEQSAGQTGFAVVLLTADDLGRAKGAGADRSRARQNVVFEMGFFFGALGRERTFALLEEGVEEPGDVKGIVYTPLDGPGAWKKDLARDLAAAGIEVDWSALGRV